MTHVLDRPVWSALTSRHANLAEGRDLARRYPSSIAPFAATPDDMPECLAALGALPGPGEQLLFIQAAPIALPSSMVATVEADAVQMIAAGPMPLVSDPRVARLAAADAADMLDLAMQTKPGPFTLNALRLGEFWGIRHKGRLVAMAGERMAQPGHTEISGVCCHPDMRGKGYARLLSLVVAGRISARGERPYLHAYAGNEPAIRLYESLGFRLRSAMRFAAAALRP
jgi:ribosomal protein S18 acetylase RimI-like enzyme